MSCAQVVGAGEQWTGFTSTLKLFVHVKILYILDWIKQVYYRRSGMSSLQICTRVGRTEHLVILLVISRTNRTCGWNFPPFTSFSFIQDPCFLFWCFWRTASHSSPAQEKEKAAGVRGKIFRGRPLASQPTSKRLPFDSLFVLLTDRITLSYTIHERC